MMKLEHQYFARGQFGLMLGMSNILQLLRLHLQSLWLLLPQELCCLGLFILQRGKARMCCPNIRLSRADQNRVLTERGLKYSRSVRP